MLRGTTIEHLLLEVGLAQSGSDASRKVQQGAVRIDGEKFMQPRTAVDRPGAFLLQVGRQICRIVVLEPTDVLLTSVPAPTGTRSGCSCRTRVRWTCCIRHATVRWRARGSVARGVEGTGVRARKRPSFRAKRVNCQARRATARLTGVRSDVIVSLTERDPASRLDAGPFRRDSFKLATPSRFQRATDLVEAVEVVSSRAGDRPRRFAPGTSPVRELRGEQRRPAEKMLTKPAYKSG